MRIAVVYLRREPFGAEMFNLAMTKHNAHYPYTLVVINKGDLSHQCPNIPCDIELDVSDFGLSLRALATVLPDLQNFDAICYLNSWTRPIKDGWLRDMVAILETPQCGLVGTSDGSVSFASNTRNPVMRWMKLFLFPPYPNWHVRTTGFAARTEVLTQIWPRLLYGAKWMEHLHESGRWSVTRRCQKLGLDNHVIRGLITDQR